MMTTNQTTMTREDAINALVERDVAKWGEEERDASTHLRAKLSHGLALNALAHYDVGVVDRELAAQAKRVMTAVDRKALRSGG